MEMNNAEKALAIASGVGLALEFKCKNPFNNYKQFL